MNSISGLLAPVSVLLLAACATPDPSSKLDPAETERKMIGLEEKFDRWDMNGNGYLTRQELVNGLKTVDVPEATPERIDDVMDFYDLDKDGRLSLRETQIGHERGPEALIEKVE